jgi:glycosyltransferase involved in cell wall biosynthesis
MKIIALIPFKNEEWVIREYINSVTKIADAIIAYDDHSIDATRKLLEGAGAKIITENYKEKSGWAEHSIRERLLLEGRNDGGTHFICLDADEVFSDTFYVHGREFIASLKIGQSLWLDWVNLYGNPETERIDSVYKKINKSFIFCDDKDSKFPYAFLGVSRTPGDPLNRKVIERKNGAVIHFQFLNTKRAAMKRMWYMCSELIKKTRSARRINVTYEIQKDKKPIPTRPITDASKFMIVDQSIKDYNPETDWRYTEILSWFDTYGIEFFEALDIWEEPLFRERFMKELSRRPRPKIVPAWLMKINDIKNTIKNNPLITKKS